MRFISYAQNFEDVMLWRALKNVDRGFYIDIGAQDPAIDSVSLAFYEHGWRGVHVEPTQQYSSKLRMARPDEIIEQVAIGNVEQELTFHEFSDTGLSTADAEIARRHEAAGFACVRTQVAMVSLESILEKHGDKPIHWLKIDVEGLEQSVLESWRSCAVRPWILIIESTKPLTQEESYSAWEHMVLDKGYDFVYFDGLNRFYVHQSHSELCKAFAAPPNVFDDFALSGLASQPFYELVKGETTRRETQESHAGGRTPEAGSVLKQTEGTGTPSEAASILAETQLKAVYASTSWRITAPLRWMSTQLRLLKQHGWRKRTEAMAKKVLRHLVTWVSGHPKAKHAALMCAKKVGVEPWLRRHCPPASSNRAAVCAASPSANAEQDQLSPHARQILADLKAAIESHKRSH